MLARAASLEQLPDLPEQALATVITPVASPPEKCWRSTGRRPRACPAVTKVSAPGVFALTRSGQVTAAPLGRTVGVKAFDDDWNVAPSRYFTH
jgi:hypothetical protein